MELDVTERPRFRTVRQVFRWCGNAILSVLVLALLALVGAYFIVPWVYAVQHGGQYYVIAIFLNVVGVLGLAAAGDG